MATRKATVQNESTAIVARTADRVKLPVSGRGARTERIMIPHDAWVDAVCIDIIDTEQRDGTPQAEYTFEVTTKLYRGTTLKFWLSEKLDQSLDAENSGSLASRFPGVNLLDPEAAWEVIGHGVPLRVHVGHEEYTDVETGERRKGLRVVSFAIARRARV